MPRSDAIDVSKYQGVIDWQTVRAADLQLAAARAVDGHGNADPMFARNWSEMRRVGIPYRIAYHFVSGRPPAEQAQRFASVVGPLRHHEGVMLDVEPDSGAGIGYLPAQHIADVCDAIGAVAGRKPLVYMGAFYQSPGMNSPTILAPPLLPCAWWLPWYRSTAPDLSGRKRSRPLLWQWSGSGSYPGVTGPCDLNEVWDWAGVRALCAAPPAPQPIPTDEDGEPVEIWRNTAGTDFRLVAGFKSWGFKSNDSLARARSVTPPLVERTVPDDLIKSLEVVGGY